MTQIWQERRRDSEALGSLGQTRDKLLAAVDVQGWLQGFGHDEAPTTFTVKVSAWQCAPLKAPRTTQNTPGASAAPEAPGTPGPKERRQDAGTDTERSIFYGRKNSRYRRPTTVQKRDAASVTNIHRGQYHTTGGECCSGCVKNNQQ